MNIIGHRGAAGLALENTRQSIEAALAAGVDAVEIDIRLTADGHFVVCHDASLRRVSKTNLQIRKESRETISQVTLHNGETVLSLEQALAATKNSTLFIEAKASDWALPLARILKNHASASFVVIARDYAELQIFHDLLPDVPTYLVQRFNPIDVYQALQQAKSSRFTGVDLNFWLLNPLTYWLARRYKLDIVVYSVNHAWLARFLARLFPTISITTNNPHRLQFLRGHKTLGDKQL